MKRFACPTNVKTQSRLSINVDGSMASEYAKEIALKPQISTQTELLIRTNCSTPNPKLAQGFRVRLSATDHKHLAVMSGMINPGSSILFSRDNEPHTLETLPEVLDLSVKKTKDLIRRLMELGLAALVTHAKYGSISQMIMLYPYSLINAIESGYNQ